MNSLWARLAELDEPAILATLVRITGSAPQAAGAHLAVTARGIVAGTLGGGSLEHEVTREAQTMLEEGVESLHRTYRLNPRMDQCCGGEVEVFLELVAPAPHAILFGGGHVGQAVARALSPLPFRVTVVDSRTEFADPSRFPEGTRVVHAPLLEALGAIPTDSTSSFALVFTHSHRADFEIISALLGRPLRYLGLIGSRTKWARFQGALLERGVPAAEIARITCPIGIGVGGKSPAEIAASVAAQLLAVRDGVRVQVNSTTSEVTPLGDPARQD
jgi:xanthine dehydrogenase accessory factor